MAKDKLNDYSATNASNTDVGGVNVDEGMLPSAVNNALRELMTHLKEFADGTNGIDVLSLSDDDASHSIKFQAPSAVTTTTTFTLPDGDGTNAADQVIKTNGSGTLAWTSALRWVATFLGENGATGDTTNCKGDIFRVHEQQFDTSVTNIASGDNAGAFFSLTVATGVTLTVNGNLVIA